MDGAGRLAACRCADVAADFCPCGERQRALGGRDRSRAPRHRFASERALEGASRSRPIAWVGAAGPAYRLRIDLSRSGCQSPSYPAGEVGRIPNFSRTNRQKSGTASEAGRSIESSRPLTLLCTIRTDSRPDGLVGRRTTIRSTGGPATGIDVTLRSLIAKWAASMWSTPDSRMLRMRIGRYSKPGPDLLRSSARTWSESQGSLLNSWAGMRLRTMPPFSRQRWRLPIIGAHARAARTPTGVRRVTLVR
jgi:hypothetical protein